MNNVNEKTDILQSVCGDKLYVNAAIHCHMEKGYVTQIVKANCKRSIMNFGEGGLIPIEYNITIILETGETKVIDEHEAIKCLSGGPDLTDNEKNKLLKKWQEFETKKEQELDARRAQMQKEKEKQLAHAEEFKKRLPSWAKAAIIAEYCEDDCDYNSDYHGAKNYQRVVIGFSKHTRDLFSEMRKAAATFKPTAHLFDADKEAEHREKYSMGGGYYLKEGYRYSTGWKVKKSSFYGESINPVGDRFPNADELVTETEIVTCASNAGDYRISKHFHTKGKFDFWICEPLTRLERSEFLAEKDRAVQLAGWYSRKWGTSPGGFAFKTESGAKSFSGQVKAEETAKSAPKSTEKAPSGDHLRKLALSMQSTIDDKLCPDRLTNTPRRMAQAQSLRNDGQKLQRAQTLLNSLATLADSDDVPPILADVKTKKRALELVTVKSTVVQNGYHTYHAPTNEPLSDDPATIAAFQLISGDSGNDQAKVNKNNEITDKIQQCKFSKIAGYFSTEGEANKIVIEAAKLKPGMQVLEPSAGSGALADEIKKICSVKCVEINHSLYEILKLKGHQVNHGDFMDYTTDGGIFDRVVMNPPFENNQVIEHFFKAYEMLKTHEGRIVCVMPKGYHLMGHSLKRKSFRDWVSMAIENGDCEIIGLPEKSFKNVGTNINAQVLIFDKSGV